MYARTGAELMIRRIENECTLLFAHRQDGLDLGP
jgi:hypothetical protein